MTIDHTTLQDLSFFKGEKNIYALINRCVTQAGADLLKKHILYPPQDYGRLTAYRDSVLFFAKHIDDWDSTISNGTLVMIEKYFESAEAAMVKPNTLIIFADSILQKLFHKNQYSFARFSVSHLIDLMQGCNQLVQLLEKEPPALVREELELLQHSLELPLCSELLATRPEAPLKQILLLSYRVRRELKHTIHKMMECYARLDALQSMARAGLEHQWAMPGLLPAASLQYKAEGLFHPLLLHPVAYDVSLSAENNFMFLTGANMSGKSTFIRSLGVAAILAHLGMAVPASAMQISFLEGIISNMQVEDNIIKGESYFFAEVQRMKTTAEKLNRSPYQLVLMDELFKGTNVHDAYECTRAVIDGLLAQKENLMVLSTHLYELADTFGKDERMDFKYFYTEIEEAHTYRFTYQLKDGVSNDRIGFMVMQHEGVLDLLHHKNMNG